METIKSIKESCRFYIRRVIRRFEITRLNYMMNKEKNIAKRAMYAAKLILVIQTPILKYKKGGFIIPSNIQNVL